MIFLLIEKGISLEICVFYRNWLLNHKKADTF